MDDLALLRRALEVAARSRRNGNHPFGAVLADADGTIVAEAENSVVTEGDATGHAETNLVRRATRDMGLSDLGAYTLYSSAEPCAMCTGAAYWAGIGRIVYGLSEANLLKITGTHDENPTMSLPCRTVAAAGQRPIDIVGPLIEEEAARVHDGFWT